MLRKTTRFSRHTYGDDGVFGKRNIVSTSFAATDLGKASNGTATAISSSLTTGVNSVTVQPSVPRNVTITGVSGTGNVVVTGQNVEGKTITETLVINGTTLVAGELAFASITSISVPASATISAGFGNKFGLNTRAIAGTATKVLVIASNGSATLEDASAVETDSLVEANTVTPTTTPNGVVQFRVYQLTSNWHVDPTNGNPSYGL